jgi:hypothetical protein
MVWSHESKVASKRQPTIQSEIEPTARSAFFCARLALLASQDIRESDPRIRHTGFVLQTIPKPDEDIREPETRTRDENQTHRNSFRHPRTRHTGFHSDIRESDTPGFIQTSENQTHRVCAPGLCTGFVHRVCAPGLCLCRVCADVVVHLG